MAYIFIILRTILRLKILCYYYYVLCSFGYQFGFLVGISQL